MMKRLAHCVELFRNSLKAVDGKLRQNFLEVLFFIETTPLAEALSISKILNFCACTNF